MKTILFILFTGFLLTLYSCGKLGNQNTYTLKGKMLKNCDGEAYVLYELRLRSGSTMFSKEKELGTATTDLNGNFEFTDISTKDRDDLYLYHRDANGNLLNWAISFGIPQEIAQQNGKTFNMGTFYGSYTVNTVAVLNIDPSQFGSGDTLYVGIDQQTYKVVYPLSGPFTYTHSLSGYNAIPGIPDMGFNLRWGIGRAFYDSLYGKLSDSIVDKHTLPGSQAALCTYPDTSYFDIPGN